MVDERRQRHHMQSTAWPRWIPDVDETRIKIVRTQLRQMVDETHEKHFQPARNSFRLALRSPSIHEGGRLIRQTII